MTDLTTVTDSVDARWYRVDASPIGTSRPDDCIAAHTWVKATDARSAKAHPDVARMIRSYFPDRAYRLRARAHKRPTWPRQRPIGRRTPFGLLSAP